MVVQGHNTLQTASLVANLAFLENQSIQYPSIILCIKQPNQSEQPGHDSPMQLRFSILSEEAAPPTPKQELAGALVLSVLSPSLPAVLRDAMSEELKRKWLSTLPGIPWSDK